jgi:hypothetical protein
MPLPDFENAARTLRAAQPLKNEIERSAILAGAWEKDATERIMRDHADQLNIDDDGKISGVDSAIASFRKANPDGFCELSRVAKNEKLPQMQRFTAAYKDILQTRDRKTKLAGLQARIIAKHAR